MFLSEPVFPQNCSHRQPPGVAKQQHNKNAWLPPANPPAVLRKCGGVFESGFLTASTLLQQPPYQKAEAHHAKGLSHSHGKPAPS
jgi:hypothetical protein